MAKITLDNTEVRDCDNERLLLAKLLQLQQSGSGSSTSDLIAEIQSGLTGKQSVSSGEFGRPLNANAYSANDVVSTATGSLITFQNIADEEAGGGYITTARLVKSTAVTTLAVFRLWLFNSEPTAIDDHAAFDLLFADRSKQVGYIDFPCVSEGSGSTCATSVITNINLAFKCAAASRNLWGILVSKQIYTPGNGETFFVELTSDLN